MTGHGSATIEGGTRASRADGGGGSSTAASRGSRHEARGSSPHRRFHDGEDPRGRVLRTEEGLIQKGERRIRAPFWAPRLRVALSPPKTLALALVFLPGGAQ